MNLNEIRATIDRIDSEILKLLNDRMEQALLSRKFKTSIEDPEREKAIIERLKSLPHPRLEPELIESIYRLIFTWSKKLQEEL